MDKLLTDHSFSDKIILMVGVGTSAPVLFKLALHMDHANMGVLATKDQGSVTNTYNSGRIKQTGHMPLLARGWTDVRHLPRPPLLNTNFRTWFKQHKADLEAQKTHTSQ